MTQNEDVLDRLERIAEAATPGGWRAQMWRGPIEWPDGYRMTVMGHGPLHPETEVTRAIADTEFIAACNPATVKALVACARALEGINSLIETVVLVRNTDDDGKPGFAMRMLPLVEALKAGHDTLARLKEL